MKKKKRLWVSVCTSILAIIILDGALVAATLLNGHDNKDPRNNVIDIPTGTETVTPTIETSNIDSVSYETLNAEKIDDKVFVQVYIEGPYENASKFVLPYSDFVKDLNPGLSDVVIKMYKSKEDYELNNPSWQYANGRFAEVHIEEQSK